MLALELCLCGELRSCALFHSQKEQVGALGKGHSYPEGPSVITSMWGLGLWLPASLCDCCQLWPFGSLCTYLYCVAHQSSSDAAQDIVFLATQIENFKDVMIYKYFIENFKDMIYKYLAGTWWGSLVFQQSAHIMIKLWIKLFGLIWEPIYYFLLWYENSKSPNNDICQRARSMLKSSLHRGPFFSSRVSKALCFCLFLLTACL